MMQRVSNQVCIGQAAAKMQVSEVDGLIATTKCCVGEIFTGFQLVHVRCWQVTLLSSVGHVVLHMRCYFDRQRLGAMTLPDQSVLFMFRTFLSEQLYFDLSLDRIRASSSKVQRATPLSVA